MNVSDMFPCLASHNCLDDGLRSVVRDGEFALRVLLGVVQSSYLNNLLCGPSDIAMIFAPWTIWEYCASVLLAMRHSAFSHGVLCVFFGSTNKQMGRVDARRIVAFVAQHHPIRNWAILRLVRYMVSRLVSAIHPNPTISIVGFSGSPYPAFISGSFNYLSPEAIHNRFLVNPMTSMSFDEFKRLSFFPSVLFVGVRRYICPLSTSTMTKAVRDIFAHAQLLLAEKIDLFIVILYRKHAYTARLWGCL